MNQRVFISPVSLPFAGVTAGGVDTCTGGTIIPKTAAISAQYNPPGTGGDHTCVI